MVEQMVDEWVSTKVVATVQRLADLSEREKAAEKEFSSAVSRAVSRVAYLVVGLDASKAEKWVDLKEL